VILTIDERWLLDIAHNHLPGDPDVVDYGAIEAARARHCAVVMGTPVYAEPHHRAAALMEQLVRIPALEHSNELYGATVAAAFLTASGRTVKTLSADAIRLVQDITAGRLNVRQVAAALRTWTEG
jgi:hypothetical protein